MRSAVRPKSSLSLQRSLCPALVLVAALCGCGRPGGGPGEPEHAAPAPDAPALTVRAVRLPEHRGSGAPRRHRRPGRSGSADCSVPGNKGFQVPARWVLDDGVVTGIYTTPDDAGWNASAHNGGGPVVGSARLQLVFWGTAWSQPGTSPSMKELITSVQALLASSYFTSLDQYGFQRLSAPESITQALNDPPTNYDETDPNDLVADLVGSGALPGNGDPGGRSVYVVFMPPGTSPPPGVGGSHPTDEGLWVAWVMNTSLNDAQQILTHELAETISDPESNDAWTMDTWLNCGPEIGDACWHTLGWVGAVEAQAYWSQRQHACVIPTFPPPTVQSASPSAASMEGGDTVTVTGTNFDLHGGTQVLFNGKPSPRVSCTSTTSCAAQVPASTQLGPVALGVVVNTFPASVANGFNYLPFVGSVVPPHGSPGDQVVISGPPLNYLPGAVRIFIGDTELAGFSCVTAGCTITVPQGCGGAHVRLLINGLWSPPVSGTFGRDWFSFDGPSLQGFSPGGAPPFGGTDIVLTGTGMNSHMQVDFIDLATFVHYPSPHVWCAYPTSCSVTVPSHADQHGYASVAAYLPGCNAAPAPMRFEWLALATKVAGLTLDSTGLGTVQLDGVASEAGAQVALTSSDPAALSVPNPLTVGPGASAAQFRAAFLTSTANETVTVTASYGTASASASLSLACGGGGCPAFQSCGGGGTPGVCGCTALTCAQVGYLCGPLNDGCGHTLDCGACATGQSCGGGGTPGVCACRPHHICGAHACGLRDDGCGGQYCCGGSDCCQ